LCRDDGDRILLVRASSESLHSGQWLLPGGGVEHGERLDEAVVREVEEETGLRVTVDGIRDVLTDVDRLVDPPALRHQDRLVFAVRVVDGALRPEASGSTDRAAWVDPSQVSLMPFTAQLLGAAGAVAEVDLPADTTPDGGVPRRIQRFAAYGLITAPEGRILLTRIADNYPGAGNWHLPGGGTDFGEDPRTALLREVVEETNQLAFLGGLVGASHRRQRNALGPEQVPVDFHGVRVVFRGTVAEPTTPRVTEVGGGSTAAAAWFAPEEALTLPLTEIARPVVSRAPMEIKAV
jgi:ADP-ribose pyrophosphatase YjhB (NUDIX family)